MIASAENIPKYMEIAVAARTNEDDIPFYDDDNYGNIGNDRVGINYAFFISIGRAAGDQNKSLPLCGIFLFWI